MKKLFPLAAFLAVALAGLVMAAFAYVANEEAGRIKFQAVADDALARIEARIDLHLSLLRAAQAFLSVNQGAVSRQQYADFIGALDLDHTYTGLRGIGFMRLATPANATDVAAYLASQYPSRGASWQPSAADRQLPVVLFAPLQETTGIGYDMYSDPPRRPALEAALRDGAMHATGQVQLGKVGGAQPFAGFLVFLALRPEPQQDETTGSTGAPVEGVVYAAFRGNELFGAALASRRFCRSMSKCSKAPSPPTTSFYSAHRRGRAQTCRSRIWSPARSTSPASPGHSNSGRRRRSRCRRRG